MHIISKKRLKEFWEQHPASRGPLEAWFTIVRATRYEMWGDLKKTFPTADKVGAKTVFNIGGNKYRLIAAVHFNRGKIYIRGVLTHEEYDQEKWKND